MSSTSHSAATLPPSRRSWDEVEKLSGYHDCLPVIAELLSNLAKQNAVKGGPSVFDGSKIAPVSSRDYLIRICKYGYCSPEVFVWMVIFLDRLHSNTGVEITPLNLHRLILVSFVLAAKLRDDTYYSNRYYASIGGVTLAEMNGLEQSFLTMVDWALFIDETEYTTYVQNMRRRAQRKSRSRQRDSVARDSPLPRASPPGSSSGLNTLQTPTPTAPLTAPPLSRGRGLGESGGATLPPLRSGNDDFSQQTPATDGSQQRRQQTPTTESSQHLRRRSSVSIGSCGGPLLPLAVP